jgi:hypothetical protein
MILSESGYPVYASRTTSDGNFSWQTSKCECRCTASKTRLLECCESISTHSGLLELLSPRLSRHENMPDRILSSRDTSSLSRSLAITFADFKLQVLRSVFAPCICYKILMGDCPSPWMEERQVRRPTRAHLTTSDALQFSPVQNQVKAIQSPLRQMDTIALINPSASSHKPS